MLQVCGCQGYEINSCDVMQVKPDIFSYSSDYFDQLMELAERLLRMEKAFIDNTPPDQMKADREARVKSPCRDQSRR